MKRCVLLYTDLIDMICFRLIIVFRRRKNMYSLFYSILFYILAILVGIFHTKMSVYWARAAEYLWKSVAIHHSREETRLNGPEGLGWMDGTHCCHPYACTVKTYSLTLKSLRKKKKYLIHRQKRCIKLPTVTTYSGSSLVLGHIHTKKVSSAGETCILIHSAYKRYPNRYA